MFSINYKINSSKKKALAARMEKLEIKERDLKERFICSGGRGGQHLNKTATCVYLKHIPTGIEVKCQQERNQALNRYLARSILLDKITKQLLKKKLEEQKKKQKLKTQNRKRSRKEKEKIRREKTLRTLKKDFRRFKTQIDA